MRKFWKLTIMRKSLKFIYSNAKVLVTYSTRLWNSQWCGSLWKLPDAVNFLVLLSESLFHLSTELVKGGLGSGQLSLSVTESILGVTKGGGQVVTLGLKGCLQCSQFTDQPVGILEGQVGFTELIWKLIKVVLSWITVALMKSRIEALKICFCGFTFRWENIYNFSIWLRERERKSMYQKGSCFLSRGWRSSRPARHWRPWVCTPPVQGRVCRCGVGHSQRTARHISSGEQHFHSPAVCSSWWGLGWWFDTKIVIKLI